MPVVMTLEDELRAKFLALPRLLQIEAIRQLLAGSITFPKSPSLSDLVRVLRKITPPE
jgi:hypothetical protein